MSEKLSDWVPLARWDQHHDYPSYGTMRNICRQRKVNGAKEFLSMVNRRLYVNVSKFYTWLSLQRVGI